MERSWKQAQIYKGRQGRSQYHRLWQYSTSPTATPTCGATPHLGNGLTAQKKCSPPLTTCEQSDGTKDGITICTPRIDTPERDESIIADQQDHYATTPDDVVQQPQASSPQRHPRRVTTRNAGNYCKEEVHQCPLRYEQPVGKREGVAISTSSLPGAASDPAKAIHFYLSRRLNLYVYTLPCKTSSL